MDEEYERDWDLERKARIEREIPDDYQAEQS